MANTPLLKLHPEAEDRFNAQAELLIAGLQKVPAMPNGDEFVPDTVTSTVCAEDIREMTMMDVGPAGERVRIFFPANDGLVGLREQSHREFVKMCETIQRQQAIRPYISVSAVEGAVLRWLRDRFLGNTSDKLIETVLPTLEKSVSPHEMWIPVDRLYLQSDVPLGRVVLRTFREGFFTAVPQLGNADDEKIRSAMQEIRRKLQGRAAATIVVTADPNRAYEVALEETEKSLSVLRFFARPMWFPDAPGAGCVVEVLDPPVNGHFVLKNGLIASWSTSVGGDGQEPWFVSDGELAAMGNDGLTVLNAILTKENQTEFEKALLSSIALYTRAAVASDVADRLLYVIASLESLLLRDEQEPLAQNVADRIAYMVGDAAELRRAIVRNYKAAYAMRSSYVHHGKSVEEVEELRTFFQTVWQFYRKLILNHSQYASRKDLLEHLEQLKYS